mgnify:CR=1 FL=1
MLTGGTGSFGKAFIKKVLNKKVKLKKLIVFSRDELKQSKLQQQYPKSKFPNLRFYLGDIRDKDRLEFATRDVDIIVHAAALKQVPAGEYNPSEFIKTNIIGAQNIIDCSFKNKIQKVVALSSDKAVAPINLYGATKLCSDKLFVSANNIIGNQKIKFSVVRYGNVMGSRGSIIPILVDKKTNQVSITDLNMTRFNITLNESITLVLDTIEKCEGGEIVIPKIPSYKLQTLVKALARNKKIKIIGVRKGEKLHEELLTKSESINALEAKDKFLLFSDTKKKTDILKKNYRFMKKITKEFSYNSKENKDYLTVQELKDLTKQEDLF